MIVHLFLDSPENKSEVDQRDCADDNEINVPNVRDTLIRKYSYKQAMCIESFSNTVYKPGKIILKTWH